MSSGNAFPPATGTTLDGRFVVQGVLGSGGMGVVLEAEHLGLRRRVAIKLLRPEFLRSRTVVHRFLREARSVATLKSEHVVDVLDAGLLWSRVPYFVMEHLPGIDLGALVQRFGPLDVKDVVHYGLQTLEALAEAHRAGVVHRDLKPTNLFLTTREDGSGFVKVLDFGVSKLDGWAVTADGIVTCHGTILGSPRYMSPEQIQDSSKADARSDIWSFGAVLHELLAGEPPFDGSTVAAVIRTICRQPYELPTRDDLSPELREILLRCLSKNKKDRFQSVAELARAFQPLAHTPAAQVSIDRILRRAGSAPPPHVVDGRLSRPSFTPISIDSTHRGAGVGYLFRTFAATFAATGALMAAFSLGRLASDEPRPAASPAPVAVTAIAPPAPVAALPRAPEPRAVAVRETPPVAAAVQLRRRTSSANKPPAIAAPEPHASVSLAANTSTPSFGDALPVPVRRLRRLDTENPFAK